MRLRFDTLTDEAIAPVIAGLAALRILVFRDWPYLYEGDPDYEAAYLKVYQDNPRAIIAAAFDGETLAGAATGLPLGDADPEFQAAFKGQDISDIFYCAESVLLPEYRGLGAGHRFFDLREGHAREMGFARVCFCSVIRPEDHPARPADYRPLAPFWRKRGYAPLSGVTASFGWRDIGAQEDTQKPMQFWMRSL